jgi:hypothetical protein
MSWQSAVLEKISRIERETISEVDQVVQNESNRLRSAMDTERNYLKAVLDETAREILTGGEMAAGRAVKKGLLVADAYREKDEARAARAEWVAMGVHDQIRSTAQQLADHVRSLEQNLAAPLVRAKRESTNDALPGLKRLVEDAAHRTAADQRKALAKRVHPPEEEIEVWRRQMVDQVRHARTAAKDRVDTTHRRARTEIERLVEELASIPEPVRKRLLEVAENRTEQAVRAGSDGRPTRTPRFRAVMEKLGLVATVIFVFFMGLVAMGVGVGFAGAAVGAIALRGAWAPPVMGGILMGVVGVTFAALFTDLLFSRLGDWRESLEDALLGAVTPLRGPGKALPARDMGNALKYVEVPQLSPDRVATPATSGTLRVSLRDGPQISGPESGEVTGRIRIPAKTKPNS